MVGSSTQGPVAAPEPGPGDGPKIYKCGSLTYVKVGLFMLFGWLLWGDFCFTLMEAVVPSVLPRKLLAAGANNTLMSVIMTSLPGILNLTVCPWVSFRSDRHRSRWGRRIPFILATMPFLVLSLIALGWGETLAPMIQGAIPSLASTKPATVLLVFLAVMLVIFQLFNMFVNSVFWYLFNDVVPTQFLGRFYGLFRMVSVGTGMLYNAFLFDLAKTHMREIFTGAALVYLFGFGIMCFFVKEGKYPPAPDKDREGGFIDGIKAMGRQSFSNKFYWFFYLMNAFTAMAALTGLGGTAMYGPMFNGEMGLTDKQIGMLTAYGMFAGLIESYITAIFVDRWHPLRIAAYLAVFTAMTGLSNWVWIFVSLPGQVFFWISLGLVLVNTFQISLQQGCSIPLFMRLMPKSLYGQFSAANAMVKSVAIILGGLFLGLCMDGVKAIFQGGNWGAGFHYRFVFIWPWFFNCISAVFVCLGYREWKRLGGDDYYRPPAPWTKEGYEEVTERVPSIPARPRVVMISMWLGLGGPLINVAWVGIFMYFMHLHGLADSLSWYAKVFIPVKMGLAALAYLQLVSVRRDIAARADGRKTRYGIPHHGVLLVNAISGLVFFPVYWYQTGKMIELNMERELIIFGIASLVTTAVTLLGVQILRWLERDVTASASVQPWAGQAQTATQDSLAQR